jgi:hypothetical protein
MPRFTPANCPHCEYDRRFPGMESGGWIQQDNNGPIVPCPLCNGDGSHPQAEEDSEPSGPCTCRWSSVNSTTIDPPEIVKFDPDCPHHGHEAPPERDPDEAYQRWRDERNER